MPVLMPADAWSAERALRMWCSAARQQEQALLDYGKKMLPASGVNGGTGCLRGSSRLPGLRPTGTVRFARRPGAQPPDRRSEDEAAGQLVCLRLEEEL